jgi:uncharacterized protein with HEPN domain
LIWWKQGPSEIHTCAGALTKAGNLSSRRDPRLYLFDVRVAADAIVSFTVGMDERSYESNRLVSSAVERNFEIIGEALNQLAKFDPMLASRIPEISRIVALRNILIHGYATVDHRRVWALTRFELLSLRAVVEDLLTELGETP